MQLWNTLTRRKDPLPTPAKGEALRLFVCGPTVYGPIHIGNARTFAVFDTFARYLRSEGKKVFYLQNITDIDDKVIQKASEKGSDWKDVAKIYERAFHQDEKDLYIASVTKYAPATRYIKEIVKQIETLIQKGNAYEIPGDGWYFDVTTFPDYGKLARRTVEQAEDGVSRIDESIGKRNRADFVLWKYSKEGEPSWKSPIGLGRPGWHIEDTAITEKYFGQQYEIHGAGVDLMFPHHEAEIAQQESASGKKPIVQLWMHAEFVVMDEAKMSKSLGNVMTARDFINTHTANVFRFLVAQHHYRSRIPFTDAAITQAKNTLASIEECYEKLNLAHAKNKKRVAHGLDVAKYAQQFKTAMDDDLNTPEALAAIFNLINDINPKLWTLTKKESKTLMSFLETHLEIFGVMLKPVKIPREIKQKVRERELFRTTQQFIKADTLRNDLESLGWRVEDTPVGPLVLRKSEARNPKSEKNSKL